jgi:hypothetical protein
VNATVLVVRVRSELDMRKLRALRADLPMAPANADHLVRSLTESSAGANAGVYPLVIFPDGRLQQDLLAISATALAPSATAAAPLVSGPSQKEGQP